MKGMPPSLNKPLGSQSAYRRETPRGYRTPRGETPRHTPRGGTPRSSNPFSRKDDDEPETRDRLMDDAYAAPRSILEINAKSFIEALIHVLRYRGGIKIRRDHSEVGEDYSFYKASSHFSYAFRHSLLRHDDGSLSLNEIFNHVGSIRKIKFCSHKNSGRRPH